MEATNFVVNAICCEDHPFAILKYFVLQGRVRLVSIVTCPLRVQIKTSVPLDSIVPKAPGPPFHACQGPSTPIAENGISQTANSAQLGISAVVCGNFSFTVLNWGVGGDNFAAPVGISLST